MTILQKIEADMKEAMKARNQDLLDALRLIKTTVKNKEIELIRPLTETEFFATLSTMAKQRNESIEQFKKGNRPDLAAKEEKELEVISTFLPKSLSDAELDALLAKAIATTAAKGPKDMGLVMKAVKDETAGRVDGKILSEKVKTALSALSAS
jgi:uncharacterized protein